MVTECRTCGGKSDSDFKRVEVWSDDRWRLAMSSYRAVSGFCYLEPKRHFSYITDLDGIDAVESGRIISKLSGQ